MPGDPLRAKWIAETFLEDARCYSEVRGMFGFTGTWRGQRVSVQGSGMGQPSTGDLRDRAVPRVRRAVDHPGRLGRRAHREGEDPRHRHRLRRLHRLGHEPDPLRGARLRPGRRLAAARGRRVGRGRPRRRARRPDLQRRLVLPGPARADDADGRARRPGHRDGGLGALHDRRRPRPPRAGDLHGLRPHRDRRGDHRRGAGADLRRHGRDRAGRLETSPPELIAGAARHWLDDRVEQPGQLRTTGCQLTAGRLDPRQR